MSGATELTYIRAAIAATKTIELYRIPLIKANYTESEFLNFLTTDAATADGGWKRRLTTWQDWVALRHPLGAGFR